MCRKALRTFRSPRRPEANRAAVTPFTPTPAAATAMTTPAATGSGRASRCRASTPIATTAPSSSSALNRAARIDDEPKP